MFSDCGDDSRGGGSGGGMDAADDGGSTGHDIRWMPDAEMPALLAAVAGGAAPLPCRAVNVAPRATSVAPRQARQHRSCWLLDQ